jgi:hypothetical protein
MSFITPVQQLVALTKSNPWNVGVGVSVRVGVTVLVTVAVGVIVCVGVCVGVGVGQHIALLQGVDPICNQLVLTKSQVVLAEY